MERLYFHDNIRFSQNISQKRLYEVSKFIDSKTINRILSLALFLLGGDRKQISNYIKIPVGTLFSFLTRLSKEGITAFFDKRSKCLPEIPLPVIDEHAQKNTNLEISFGDKKIQIDCDETIPRICIDSTNPLQFKTLILTLVQSGIVKPQQASTLLQISQRYVRQLCTDLKQNDIEAIIDRRKGQKGDFAFTSNVKAELIQQYTAHVVSGGSTTSSHIARQVNKACNTTLSERTFRHHIAKMGLNTIKHSLPRLLGNLKKTQQHNQ